jgi:hypothetical protein
MLKRWFRAVAGAAIGVIAGLAPWVTRASASDNNWTSVAYGNGVYVKVAHTGTNRVATSPDAITWTPRTPPEDNQWRHICFAEDLGIFCAVALDGTNRVMTSPDGIAWTMRSAAAANQWAAVTRGGGLFVAVAISGTDRIMTSPTGETWTIRTGAAALQYFDVAYGLDGVGGGIFIAVAAGSTSNVNKFVKSTDGGVTWTPFFTTTQQFLGIIYVPWLSLWVVAAGDGAGNRFFTSPDGTTFTSRSISGTAVQWEKVAFSSNLVVIIGSTTGTDRIATSPDAITWTLQTTPVANNWADVTYGGGKFVAVSMTGTGNRVMTSP